MKSSQSLSEPVAAAKPPPYCAFPNCKVPPTKTCSRCKETQYCSKEHQTDHWKWHKKICVAPSIMMSAPVPLVPLKGSVDEEDKYEYKCVICLVNVPDAQIHPCGHSMICRYCTQDLINRSQPCLICRKPISSFEVGVYSGNLGERGLWPSSARNPRELARNDGFNEYFRKQFNGKEATFLQWKEVFDVLEIVGGRGNHCTMRESMVDQMLSLTRAEDLVKLRALAELCSWEFSDDRSLFVVAWRRILEVLELAMPDEKKVRGKKKKQQQKKDLKKLQNLGACEALGRACNRVHDWGDAELYTERAKEGYEERLGRDGEKALEATSSLITFGGGVKSEKERIEKTRDLVKRMERALGEENDVTLGTLNQPTWCSVVWEQSGRGGEGSLREVFGEENEGARRRSRADIGHVE